VNWLAHAFLSEPDIEFRLGNLLADLVRGPERQGMSTRFRAGTVRHQQIDIFTDAHPVVKRSCERISKVNRRFSGILVDVFYDHFLAKNFEVYSVCSESLDGFVGGVYEGLGVLLPELTGEAKGVVERMILEDRLASYRSVRGIQAALWRLSMRFVMRRGRTFDVNAAMEDLVDQQAEFEQDFAEFFPAAQREFPT
jgi:acyl carrier protein phosphodiesterase